MKRLEFAAFLDYRQDNPPHSTFDKQISVLTGELDFFRNERQRFKETRERISKLLTEPNLSRSQLQRAESFKDMIVDTVQPPSVLIALEPLRNMADQLRSEMRMLDSQQK